MKQSIEKKKKKKEWWGLFWLFLSLCFLFVYSVLPSPCEAEEMRKQSSASLTPQCSFLPLKDALLSITSISFPPLCPSPGIPVLTLKFLP